MLKFVTRKPSVAKGRFHRFFVLDPELLEAVKQESDVPSADFESVSEKFSLAISGLRIAGTYKKTNPNRLKKTEQCLASLFSERANASPRILDVAVSDGVTTLELANALSSAKLPDFSILACDVSLRLMRKKCGLITEYHSEADEPILARMGPIGLELSKHCLNFQERISRTARFYLQRGFRKNLKPAGEISLLNPYVQKSRLIKAVRMSLFENRPELHGNFDAARLCNVLVLTYFTPEQIIQGITNICRMLKESGILIISRNNELEIENGSAWIKTNGELQLHSDWGTGAEIKELVDQSAKQQLAATP